MHILNHIASTVESKEFNRPLMLDEIELGRNGCEALVAKSLVELGPKKWKM